MKGIRDFTQKRYFKVFREDRSSSGADSSAPIIAHQVVDKYVEKYGLN